MTKSLVPLLVLFFLASSCLIVAKPVSGTSSIIQNSWATKSPMPQAMSDVAAVAVNGKIFAIGSSGSNEEYDPSTDMWTIREPIPTYRQDFAMASYLNKIYCIGGYANNGRVTGVNEVYDIVTDTWTTKSSMPTNRSWLDANVVDGKIYLIGGQNDSSLTQVNEIYNIAADSWTISAPIPTATSAYASAVVDNKIFFMSSSINQIYDIKTGAWNLGASPPLPVWAGKAVATVGMNAPEKIYVLSAISSELVNSNTTVNQVYDPKTDTWVVGAPLPTTRYSFGFTVSNDLVYAIGGFTTTYQNFPDDLINGPSVTLYSTNEQYTPFGYGTVSPTVSVSSPENKNYSTGEISLNFTMNKAVNWVGYSLDGKDNVTITGNTTLSGLSNGSHNITVYAKDSFENIGASETVVFIIASEPFPIVPVAAVSAVAVAVVAIGLIFYYRKQKVRA